MTDFRLLGPLEALEGGEPVDLPAGKPRALLAQLLLDANRVVSTEAIVDGLWGQRPPASAHKLVQVYVSKVRKALGRDCIETRSPGYRVLAAPERYDLGRFEDLTELASSEPDVARRLAPERAGAGRARTRRRHGGVALRRRLNANRSRRGSLSA